MAYNFDRMLEAKPKIYTMHGEMFYLSDELKNEESILINETNINK